MESCQVTLQAAPRRAQWVEVIIKSGCNLLPPSLSSCFTHFPIHVPQWSSTLFFMELKANYFWNYICMQSSLSDQMVSFFIYIHVFWCWLIFWSDCFYWSMKWAICNSNLLWSLCAHSITDSLHILSLVTSEQPVCFDVGCAVILCRNPNVLAEFSMLSNSNLRDLFVTNAGLAFDSWDLDYYTSMFQRIKRNPTSVECFDLAQSNRFLFSTKSMFHPFGFFTLCDLWPAALPPLASTAVIGSFGVGWRSTGRSRRRPSSAWSWAPRVTATRTTSSNSATTAGGHQQRSVGVAAFRLTRPHCPKLVFSSGIQGAELECIYPTDPSQASPYQTRRSLRHVIFTAETHNFPTGRPRRHKKTSRWLVFPVVFSVSVTSHIMLTWISALPPGVAPFSGATTGTGGRIRDVQSAGKGGHVIAGTAGYCFGNLHIPGVFVCGCVRASV